MNGSQWFLILAVNFACLLDTNHGWIRFSDGHFASAWQPIRRSPKCYITGEECLQTSQCCNTNDVCLMDKKQSELTGRKIGHCHDIDAYKGMMKDLKQEGDECSDSYECGKGLCCRAILRYRYGIVHRCGKSEGPYICISVNDLPQAVYDVMQDQLP